MNAGAELGSWVGESWKSGKIPSCFTNIFWWKICLKIGQNEKKGPPTPHSRNMSNHFFCCTTLSPAKSGPSIFRVDNAWSCCRGSPIFFVEQRLDQRNRINHPFSSKNPLSRHRATSFWVEFGCFWPIKWLIQGHCFRTGDFLSVKNISGGETHRRRPQKILRDFLRENLGVNLMEIGFSRWNGFFWIFFWFIDRLGSDISCRKISDVDESMLDPWFSETSRLDTFSMKKSSKKGWNGLIFGWNHPFSQLFWWSITICL